MGLNGSETFSVHEEVPQRKMTMDRKTLIGATAAMEAPMALRIMDAPTGGARAAAKTGGKPRR